MFSKAFFFMVVKTRDCVVKGLKESESDSVGQENLLFLSCHDEKDYMYLGTKLIQITASLFHTYCNTF